MIFFKLAIKSLYNRKLTTFLTVISIALSVSLLLCVERAKRASEEGFTQTISQTDLIVGARSGTLQLLLYSVFNIGAATNNISWASYEELAKNPAVKWTIPFSLGDSHRGFRVIGTTEEFFKHYHYRGNESVALEKGGTPQGVWDVVIGAEVAKKLKYVLGDRIVISHGVTKGEAILQHDDKPFEVVGVLKKTGTPLDRAVYISLEGMEALHIDWQNGSMPTPDKMIPASQIKKEDIRIHNITSVFLAANSRLDILRLQRSINEYEKEPLMAIIPGVVISELWQGLGSVERVLRVISWMVVVVGFMAMLIALMTTLNERRREMAIFRAVGARPVQIMGLLVFESAFLTAVGVFIGVVFSVLAMSLLKPWLENTYGLYLSGVSLTQVEYVYIVATLVGGTLIGFIPALAAQRQTVKDGLSVRL